jgi:hypothetical protein
MNPSTTQTVHRALRRCRIWKGDTWRMVMEGLEAAEAQSKPPPVPDAEYSVPTADRRYEERRR